MIDAETGEKVNELFPGDKYRIIRKSQIEYAKKNKDELEKQRIYKFGQDERFSMLSSFSAKQLANEKLTGAEYRVLLIMISNTNYKSGLVTLGNNHDITVDWLSKALKISKNTTDSCIKTLVDRGIIARNTTNHRTQYFFNPYIQYKGAWINKTLYDMFKHTYWAKRDNR